MKIDLSGIEQRRAQWRMDVERRRAAWYLWLTVGMLFVLAGCACYVVNHLEAFTR